MTPSGSSMSRLLGWPTAVALMAILIARDACDAVEWDDTRLGRQGSQALAALVAQQRQQGMPVVVVADDGIPPGWQAAAAGVHLRLTGSPLPVEVWAVSRDWIGLRTAIDPRAPFTWVWNDDLVLGVATADTHTRAWAVCEAALPGAVATMPPLRIAFRACSDAQVTAFDDAAAALVERCCRDESQRHAALLSFTALGIPAPRYFTRMLGATDPRTAQAAATALAHLDSPLADGLLLQVLARTEPAATRTEQRLAAFALAGTATAEQGPELLAAFERSTDPDTADWLVRALQHAGYQPAGAAILARAQRAARNAVGNHCFAALGSLRYEPALPVLAAFSGEIPITGDTLCALAAAGDLSGRAETAWLRIAATWGAPADGFRLLLMPKARTTVGKDCHVVLLFENLTRESHDMIEQLMQWTITIDGVPHAGQAGGFSGNFSLAPHGVWFSVCDLGTLITRPGTYRITYRARTAVSNEVTLVVADPRDAGK
jgi:hypothetical protein